MVRNIFSQSVKPQSNEVKGCINRLQKLYAKDKFGCEREKNI